MNEIIKTKMHYMLFLLDEYDQANKEELNHLYQEIDRHKEDLIKTLKTI